MTAEMAEVLLRMKKARLHALEILIIEGHLKYERAFLKAEIEELKKIIKER